MSARTFRLRPRNDLVVDTGQIVELMSAGADLTLFDARDPERFRGEIEPIDAVAGHIPGAVNLPYSRALREDGTCRSSDELGELWSVALGPDERRQSIVMCGSGVTACHLVMTALRAGYREPRVYVGSWSEWIRDPGRPVVAGTAE